MKASKVVLEIVRVTFMLLIAVVIIFGLITYGGRAYNFGYQVFAEKPMDDSGEGKDIQVAITKDMSNKEIGQLLEDKGLVQSAALFQAQAKVSESDNSIQPGIYTLNTSQSAQEMIEIMSEILNTNEEKAEE